MTVFRGFQMTPYRVRLALNALTVLLVLSIAFALAGLTWRLAGYAGTGAVMAGPDSRPAAVPDMAPAIALAPFGKGAVALDGANPTSLQVTLKGIVFARPETLSVAWIAQGTEAAKPYRIGEAVAGAPVEAIQVSRVLVRNAGRLEFIAFPDPAGGAAAPGAPPQVATAPVPPPPTPNAPPSLDPAQFLQRMNATPVSGGYQVGQNAPPGLRAGDVVRQLNGAPLTSPDAAREALAGAQSTGTAQIQVVRDGKPLTITVPIR